MPPSEIQTLPWTARLAQRIPGRPLTSFALSLILSAVVAVLDYVSGYELRFAILYLLPIALATWTGGLWTGLPIVALSGLFWLLSFGSTHPYSGDFFFYWEGVAMLAVYIALAVLLSRLRIALNRADERFRLVLEELHAAVYVADQDSGAILYANQNLANLINANPHTLSAEVLDQRFGLVRLAETDASSTRGGPIESGFTSREVRDPASGRWFLVKVGPIPWKTRQRVRLQVITDISEMKHSQALKRQHQEMLHQNSRLAELAEVASSLAHEVNQPLMAVASYNDACVRMLENADFDRSNLITALQRSREQAWRAGRIISRVRSFIRSKRPSPSHFDMNELVRESIELIEAQLEDRSIRADVSLSDSPLVIHADRTLLAQVILNLLQNAIDAMENTPLPHRMLSVTSTSEETDKITISVTDHGTGVPEALSEQAYTPLFTTKTKGLGLGLSICRSVVEAHGGRIWHETVPEGGCTFCFTIPADSES